MTSTTKVWAFVGATFALTWAAQAPGILALRAHTAPSAAMMLLLAIGSAGPTLVAIAFAAIEDGRRGVSSLLRRADYPKAPWQLCAIALLLTAAAHLLGSALLLALGLYEAKHVVYWPLRSEEIAIAIVAPLGEEYGWRGYALPRLQAALTPLAASLWLAVAWALWHVPTLFVPGARGSSPLELIMYLLAFVASGVIYTWLFNAGRGSMRGPLLAHLGIHLDNVFRASASGDGVLPLTVTSVLLGLFAIALVVTGRLGPETAVTVGRRPIG